METIVEINKCYTSMLINSTWIVRHRMFTCTMNMMLQFGYSPEEGRWTLEMCDYLDMNNVVIDGKHLGHEDTHNLFKSFERVGLDYEGECIDKIEQTVQSLSNKEIMDLFKPQGIVL